MSMSEFNIETLSVDNIDRYKNCFDKNGSQKKKSIIHWQFFENPVNKQYVDLAIDTKTNNTAAIYAIFPVKIKVLDDVFVGSQSLDTITDIDYRGKGLFINLAKDVFNKALLNEVKLVYGFPNGNSIYGFQKKLEWEVLDPVPFLIKPFRTAYFTKKIPFLSWLPNINLVSVKNKRSSPYKIEIKNEFPVEVNAIWKKFSSSIKVAVQRDKEYLEWRYSTKPDENYEIAHAYSSTNEYLGFIVYTVKKKHEGSIGYIMELIYDINNTEVGKHLLAYAVNQINLKKADCVLSWCLEHSPNYKDYKSNNFYSLPEKFRPIELHFGARSFDDNYKEIINNRNNWYLSYSDSDTV
jgi:hypothetical protein